MAHSPAEGEFARGDPEHATERACQVCRIGEARILGGHRDVRAVHQFARFFPANIYAAVNRIPMGGHEWGPVYLLIRAPLQAIVLLWVYWFTIRQPDAALRARAAARVHPPPYA